MKNYGFQKDKIAEEDYVFGASRLPQEILQPDGQWDEWLPEYEPQAENYETNGCTVWGTQNCIETLYARKNGIAPNFSERFTYILAGVRPPGSTPKKIADNIHRNGLIGQAKLPIPATFDEFITPDPLPPELLQEGRKWLEEHDLGYEFVWKGAMLNDQKIQMMKEALRYSPLGVSVTAWYENDGIYDDNGMPNNHWCECYGYTDKGWKIFDSYDHSHKIYSFNSNIDMAMRYNLDDRWYTDNGVEKNDNWLVQLWQVFINLITNK